MGKTGTGHAARPDRAGPREWVSFPDPHEDRTWTFDVTFLLSGWNCVFGRGCQGVLTEPAPELVHGCCSYGAHFSDPEDEARVVAAAETLDASEWQFARQGRRRGVVKSAGDGARMTRLVDGACVFLNRPGFGAGAGCAFHQAAAARGIAHLELKPDVCWQLPLRREDSDPVDGHVTSTVSEWGRRHWGGGGEDFAWWCTEAPEAFGDSPVYLTMAEELTAIAGTEVYAALRDYLDRRAQSDRDRRRRGGAGGAVSLPHPTVRPRPGA